MAATPLQIQCAFTVDRSALRWLRAPCPSQVLAQERRPTPRPQAPEPRERRPRVFREARPPVVRAPHPVELPADSRAAAAEESLAAEARAVRQILVLVRAEAETAEVRDEAGMAPAA